MLRSMASAITGLRNHQLYMDIVANNIANVNTAGFKSSRINFKDTILQTIGVGSAPLAATDPTDPPQQGGTNPAQLGLGVTVGAIDNVMLQGALTPTGKNTDLSIQGEGFFILQGASGSFYTRDGALSVDKDGYLVEPTSGNYVMGIDGSGSSTLARIRIDPAWGWSGFSISGDGAVVGVSQSGALDTAHQPRVQLAKFSNAEGLLRAGGNLWKEGPNSGTPSVGSPITGGRGTLIAGALEGSNVDLAEQFSRMIMAERGFQANSRVITTSDEMLQDLVNLKR